MAGARPDDVYGSFGSVPTVTSQGGGPQPMQVRANPNEFGAQVGAAIEGAGKEGFDLAIKQQGMINETLATNADADLAKKIGDIKGAYFAKSGLEAKKALPQYQADLEAARESTRATLPSGAARAFDVLATRSVANNIADGSVHAAGQLKQWQIESGSSFQNQAVQALADPTIASNPKRVGEQIGHINYGAQMQLDENSPGLKTDPQTGTVNFDESTPEGQQAKAAFQRNLDAMIGQGQVNRFNTLAKQNPIGAYDVFQQAKDSIPKMAQVHIEASLAPQVFNAHVNGATGSVLDQAAQAHYQILTNPSGSGVNSNNLGNVKTTAGAAEGTQSFVNPATPVDGVVLTANNLRNGYQGMTLTEIGKKWTGESPEKAAAWVKNASSASGIAPDTIPDLNDPKQLSSLLKGIGTAEKSPSDRAKFTDDVISQGVQASLSGKQPQVAQAAEQTGKPYGTNPDGSPFTKADYYRTHSQDVFANGDAYAEKTMPGNLEFRKAVHSSLQQYMSTTIENETATYKQDNMFVQKAINGELTNGKRPTTYDELSSIPTQDGNTVGSVLNRVQVHSPEYAKGIYTQLDNATKNAPGFFANVDFKDSKNIASATQLAVAQSAKTGDSVDKTMWNSKDSARFNEQWSALPLQGDSKAGTAGKLDVLRSVRDGAGPYAANVFAPLKNTYPNASYAAAIPDDKTAGEIVMGDQRITEDKNHDIPLAKVDAAMQEDGYDKALLPQQYDQVKSAARAIFASRFSSGQNISDDDIKGAVKSALGGMEKTNYGGKPILSPVGVSGSQMDKFLSNVDNNDIIAGMNNAQMELANTKNSPNLELPRLQAGTPFQADKTPFTLQTVAPGMYMVMQPTGDPYPAPGIKGGKMIVKFTPDMITGKKVASIDPSKLAAMGM